jgi:NTE family protein
MPITVEHLVASSALPFIFPPVHINREFFGDGSMRQIAPVSPALHLGANRLLVIGVGRQLGGREVERAKIETHPSLAQIAGHALNSIFLDSLMVDIERMERINRTLKLVPPESLKDAQLRPIRLLFITPSQPLERIAARFIHELPGTVRFVLRPTGALNRSGSNLASYLLFEEPFCRALIDLGYQDTVARESEVREFFGMEESAAHA